MGTVRRWPPFHRGESSSGSPPRRVIPDVQIAHDRDPGEDGYHDADDGAVSQLKGPLLGQLLLCRALGNASAEEGGSARISAGEVAPETEIFVLSRREVQTHEKPAPSNNCGGELSL